MILLIFGVVFCLKNKIIIDIQERKYALRLFQHENANI